MRALLDRHLGDGWETRDDDGTWERLDAIPDAELWAVRCALRGERVLIAGRTVEYLRGEITVEV